jgi:hypothetical protein
MEVVIGSAERQESALFALLQHDPSDDAKRCRSRGDRPVVREPDRHVKSNGLACHAAIVRGMIETIVGRAIAEAMTWR